MKFPKLKSKLILAPMHDITNIAFRLMCKKYGAGLVSTELLSANALSRENKAVMKLAKCCRKEKPIAIQLFGQNTENIVKAAKLLENKFEIIDINLGCPSERIMRQGSGGALLRRKNKIKEIVEAVSKEIKKPLSVKIRSGYYRDEAVKISKICEPFVSAITIHARTVKQGYSEKAKLEVIKNVKENVNIPVIGNGDVWTGEDAKKMFKETKCDYIMIGRAAIGNPFIFKQIRHYLKTGKRIKQSNNEKIKDYFEYIKLCKKHNCYSLKDAKNKAQEFTKGMPESSKLRKKLNQINKWREIKNLLKEYTNIYK